VIGQPPMVIVPDDATLLIEAFVQNKDIGFVHEGQAAEIKVEPFPFTRYGLISAEAVKLARDSMTPSSQDGQAGSQQQQPGNLFYAEVSMSRDEILVGGRWVRPQQEGLPGMNRPSKSRPAAATPSTSSSPPSWSTRTRPCGSGERSNV